MEAPWEKCGFICRESLAEKREEAMTEGTSHDFENPHEQRFSGR
jgi:hypothetical protein